MQKQINYKLVDTAGQVTAIVLDNISRTKQSDISVLIMSKDKKVEQVGFLEKNNSRYRVQMMGNELSINGSLAGAYLFSTIFKTNEVRIQVSGLNTFIKAKITKGKITAYFPTTVLVKKESNNFQLSGITYTCLPLPKNKIKLSFSVRTRLFDLAGLYKSPATGIIYYNKSEIKPLVYVKDTNSFVWERACGSGSLSYSLFSGYSKIKQPSGQYIEVKKFKSVFAIKSPVSIII